MNPQEVIDAYLHEVMRFLPRKDRNDIAFELRVLLSEMVSEHELEGQVVDERMVLALLHEFGVPLDIARRYRAAGVPIIPEEQTRSFTLLSLIGVALQWAGTFPQVLDGLPLSQWWLTSGLGALWWPGFMVTMAIFATWVRPSRGQQPVWRPRSHTSDRIHRTAWVFALVGTLAGIAFMVSLPWLVGRLPTHLVPIFAFAPEFLAQRAWPALPLWAGSVAVWVTVWRTGRWTVSTRRLEFALNLAFAALLIWWASGDIFVSQSSTQTTQPILGFVVVMICLSLAVQTYARRTRIHPPKVA